MTNFLPKWNRLELAFGWNSFFFLQKSQFGDSNGSSSPLASISTEYGNTKPIWTNYKWTARHLWLHLCLLWIFNGFMSFIQSSFSIFVGSFSFLFPRKWVMKSMGRGKIIVEFFSADIELRVWKRYWDCLKVLYKYINSYR